MGTATVRNKVERLLDAYGTTFADEIGIRLKDAPAPLFQLLCASVLMAGRVAADDAVEATKGLLDAKLTTAAHMADATWQDRADVLTSHGYEHAHEGTAATLGDTAAFALERYGGDLRKLREEAGRDVGTERGLLKAFKGLSATGADIFLREVQAVWPEAYPFADDQVLQAAEKLGLGSDAASLSKLVPREDFPRLTAALVRVDLAKAWDDFPE